MTWRRNLRSPTRTPFLLQRLPPSLDFPRPRRRLNLACQTVLAADEGVPEGTPLVVRFYHPRDYLDVIAFDCETYGADYTRDARSIVRDAPDYLEDGEIQVWIILAEDRDRIVGVIVFGHREDGAAYVFSLGVVRDRRCEGIGTKLKRAALWEFQQRGVYVVQSHVEARNYKMLGLNDKIGVNREPHPDEPGMFLCLAVLETTIEDAAIRSD